MAMLPDYMLAADIHNLGNTGTSWLDPDMYAQKFGNAGKLAVTSILSGANSFYNTAITVGNWFGANLQENKTQDWISQIDSDWGAYYRQNSESADLGGFVLGSLIPGLGGIKVLNAGQVALKAGITSGRIGGNIGRAAGLLTPSTEKYVTLAAEQINSSRTAVSLLNTNTAKAIGAGLWQNTLESAAFETFAMAAQFKSPVLDNMGTSDVISNITVGGILGGAIGGALNTAKIFGALKKSVREEDVLRAPFINRPAFAEITPAQDKIISLAWDTEMAAVPVQLRAADGTIIQNNYAVTKNLYQDKITKNLNDIRTEINGMAHGDTELGNMVANASTPLKDLEGNLVPGYSNLYFQNFSGAVSIVRAMEMSPVESAARKLAKEGGTPEPIAARFVRVLGEGAGETLDRIPGVLSMGDLFVGQKAILGKVREYGFKPENLWNPLEITKANPHLEAEARHIWAHNILSEIKPGTAIHVYDIPMLERAYLDSQLDIVIKVPTSKDTFITHTPASRDELWNLLKNAKENVANEMLLKLSYKGGTDVADGSVIAARIANTKVSYLEGTRSPNEFNDLMAHQATAIEYKKSLQDRGLSLAVSEAQVDPLFLPKVAKVIYKQDADIAGANGTIADAVTFFKSRQALYVESAKNVVAKNLGELAESLPDIPDSAVLNLSRADKGARLFSNENSNYGTYGSMMAWIGSITRSAKEQLRKTTSAALEPALVDLGKKPAAAIEFEGINQKITRSGKTWVYDPEMQAMRSIEKNAEIDSEFIPVVHKETAAAIQAHIAESGKRTTAMREVRAAQGHTDAKDPGIYRPIRPDLKQYPHFAFVTDPQVTGTGHMTMIHAASEKELGQLIDRVPQNYKVVTKGDSESFFKARGEYEYQRTLHENYLDGDLANRGVFSNFFPKSDPDKIINDILQQHLKDSDVLVMENVRLRYEPQFNMLEDLGKQYSKIDTSKFASRADVIEKSVDNPYFNHIKTALDISKINEHPLIYGFNKHLDEAFSRMTGALQNVWNSTKNVQDLDKLNGVLDTYGVKPAYYDAALHALANHTAPRGELTKFVQKANGLLSLFTLGLDPLNSLNNAIGSNILRMTELRHLTDAIRSGDTQVAGELGKLAKITLPGTDDTMLAPTKLVSQAISNFWKDDGALLAKYKDAGYIKDRVEQLKLLVDDFTLKGTETVQELNTRLGKAFAKAQDLAGKGETLTGNKLAEEFNRFISANVMDQLTDIGVRRGLMDNAQAAAYINTFVNRVEGNIISSQRPMIFQGPIGQAIGLFQSYQFNLLQQLFRYVAEGSKKDIATLLGLQSTLYGLQSLPAFQFLNTHIVGQLSGNQEHKDAYDAIYGATGRTAGNFLLYGIPSNILQANIYSRGDINPRQITILPTSLQEIPIVAGWGKFLGSMKETLSKINGGGTVWESILQGVEHNGISRPLAGFAQVLQGIPSGTVYSTSNRGSILYSNDLFSLASLTRLAGGRPLDEAIVNDALFRVRNYEAARRKDMESLAETVKTSLVQGNQASSEQVAEFAKQYAASGGKQSGFNKWMLNLYKTANVSQAQQLQMDLKNPFSYKMQLLMGGSTED